MEQVKRLILDIGKGLLIGLLAGIVLGVILFLAGFLLGDIQILNGLEVSKDGLLLLAALGMFLIAGMLLAKGKKPEKFEEKDAWRKHFSILGYKSVLLLVCIAVLMVAAAADYMIWLIRF